MAFTPKIAIVGAGPAGLTLARLLCVSKAKIDLVIYELDACSTSRSNQGGTLDLHDDTGLAAIRKCGLWDSFQRYARYDGQEFIVADKNATELVHMKGGEKPESPGPSDRPEIDRRRLKEVLLESVPENCVRWGYHLREVTESGLLKFDGREDMEGPFDLVVGADGAWSKVRTKLTTVKPSYAGVSGYEIDIREPSKTCPHVDKRVGRGSFFGPSDRKLLNAQRMGDNSIKARSWYVCPEGAAQSALDKYGREGTLEQILQRYAGWAPEMVEFFKQGDLESLRHWTLYELPVGKFWKHKEGFTLLGDAASLATPFSGKGVNKAMTDALELAELIERSQDPADNLTLDQAVLHYEKSMFPRAERLQAETMSNKQAMFTSDTAIDFMTHMLRMKTKESSSILIQMLGTTPFVAVFFIFFWIRTQIGLATRRLWRKT